MRELIYFISKFYIQILTVLAIYFVLRFIFSKTVNNYHSNWNTLIDDFNFSSKAFYAKLKTELESHGITKIIIKEVYHKEGGTFSHSRLYLRATWKGFEYDICAAPFGKGFFISWWLIYKDSMDKVFISKIPFIGKRLVRALFPMTYFRIDTASMFMTYAQSSVLKVIDEITESNGLHSLSEEQRKPILNNVFIR